MADYILALFDHQMSDDDLQYMYDLCPGLKIEWLNANDSEAIARGISYNLQGRDFGFAFRLMIGADQLSLLFIRYTPCYVGRFTSEEEKRCIAIAELCRRFDGYHQLIHQIHAEFEEDYEDFFELIHLDGSFLAVDIEEPTEMFLRALVDGKNELSDIYKCKRIELAHETNIAS